MIFQGVIGLSVVCLKIYILHVPGCWHISQNKWLWPGGGAREESDEHQSCKDSSSGTTDWQNNFAIKALT